MPPEVLQRLTWNGTPKELGDLFVLHKNRRTAGRHWLADAALTR